MPQKDILVTIDFWDTLVIAEEGGKRRRKIRHDALYKVSGEYVQNLPDTEIEAATQEASDEFHRVWFNQQRTPTTDELIKEVLDVLGVPASQKELDYLVNIFEESLLEGPPKLVPGAKKVVAQLARKYKLGLISDTMYSPGRVLRQYLDKNELLHHFDDFIFSDEAGFSKPNPRAFTQILESTGCKAEHSCHIGDRLNTDVKGAKDAGMKAILFTGVSGKKDGPDADTEPDYVCVSWEEVKEVLL